MVVVYVSCGANICPLYFKTKFHVLINVKKRKNVQQWHLTITGRMWRFTPLGVNASKQTLTVYIIVTNGVLLVKLEFRWAFTVCFHEFGFSFSKFLHHFFVILFHLLTLEIRVSPCFEGEGVYPCSTWVEMLTLYV